MVYLFRVGEPIRRADRAVCQEYTSYRKTLRKDFYKRCGYCNDSDEWRLRSFAIDHFVPQNPKGFINDIAPNYYYNLVYACNFCNLSKSNKWPTNNPKEFNNGTEGFIDPTTKDYTNLFKRDNHGKITCNGENPNIAAYILRELKLWYPVHQITWKLERLNILEGLVEEKIKNIEDEEALADLERIHYDILKELKDIYKNLFIINE